MINSRYSIGTAVVLMAVVLVAAAPDANANVTAGSDLFHTIGGADEPVVTMDSFFTVMPIDADFFGPGSDPFDGQVYYGGAPLTSTEDLKNTDVIVERLEEAILPDCPSSDTVGIIIRGLRLQGRIYVSYNSGKGLEAWDVTVCLSSTEPQFEGSMIINKECDAGGTFSSELPIIPRMIFTRVSDGEMRFIDPVPDVTMNATDVPWIYTDYEGLLAPYTIVTSAGGMVDHDCNGSPDSPYPPSGNFIAAVRPTPCDCASRAPVVVDREDVQEIAEYALHGVEVTYLGERVPTLSEWGLIIFSLVVLSIITVVVTRRRAVAAGVGGADLSTTISGKLFVPVVYFKTLAVTLALAGIGLVIALIVGSALPLRDVVGTLLSATIAAYSVHLWICRSRG